MPAAPLTPAPRRFAIIGVDRLERFERRELFGSVAENASDGRTDVSDHSIGLDERHHVEAVLEEGPKS